VDISDVIEERRAAIEAFKSQFFDPGSKEPETYISSENFMNMLEGRAMEFGMRIGVKYAEGFKVKHAIGVDNLFQLL
jgi:LmbE family N-acetylglucosaminyl deacetylase